MHDRIKELRDALNLTQQEFADRIGVKRSTIAKYEGGWNVPLDAVISMICREFNVSERWLRTGEGEMFQPVSRNEELFTFALSAAKAPPDDVRAQLLSVMARLSTDDWAALARVARLFLEEAGAAPPSSPKDSETGPD